MPSNTWNAWTPEEQMAAQAYADARQRETDRKMRRSQLAGNIVKRGVQGVVLGAAGGAALAPLFSGAGAAAGAGSVASSAPTWGTVAGSTSSGLATAGSGAATAGMMSRLSPILNSSVLGAGVNAASAYGAQRSQSKSAEQARQDVLKSNAEALALQRQQLEMEARNADLDRADAKALNEAINELKRRELAASEEQRSFERGVYEQSEARREPYRQVSQQALQRLSALWGLG